MMTKSKDTTTVQSHLFKPLLRDIVSPRHAMVKLADAIDWKSFEDGLQEYFCADNGRPSCPVRLMVALHYLKYASGMSAEAVTSGLKILTGNTLPAGFILSMNIRRINRQCHAGARDCQKAEPSRCWKKA